MLLWRNSRNRQIPQVLLVDKAATLEKAISLVSLANLVQISQANPQRKGNQELPEQLELLAHQAQLVVPVLELQNLEQLEPEQQVREHLVRLEHRVLPEHQVLPEHLVLLDLDHLQHKVNLELMLHKAPKLTNQKSLERKLRKRILSEGELI